MPRNYGPPLPFRLLNDDLQFFNGQGWVSIKNYMYDSYDGDPDEVVDDMATALEEVQAELDEES